MNCSKRRTASGDQRPVGHLMADGFSLHSSHSNAFNQSTTTHSLHVQPTLIQHENEEPQTPDQTSQHVLPSGEYDRRYQQEPSSVAFAELLWEFVIFSMA